MDINASTVSLFFCLEHVDTDLTLSHPDFKFNWYPAIKGQKCMIDGCYNNSHNVFIGVKIPDTAGPNIRNQNVAIKEIFDEAMQALSGGPAVDKLSAYLYFKIRIFSYDCGDFVAFNLLKQYAKIVLRILKISEDAELGESDIKRILNRLHLLPEGHKL